MAFWETQGDSSWVWPLTSCLWGRGRGCTERASGTWRFLNFFSGSSRGIWGFSQKSKAFFVPLLFPSCPFSLWFFSVRFQPIISRKASPTLHTCECVPGQPRTNGLNPCPHTRTQPRPPKPPDHKSDRFTWRVLNLDFVLTGRTCLKGNPAEVPCTVPGDIFEVEPSPSDRYSRWGTESPPAAPCCIWKPANFDAVKCIVST